MYYLFLFSFLFFFFFDKNKKISKEEANKNEQNNNNNERKKIEPKSQKIVCSIIKQNGHNGSTSTVIKRKNKIYYTRLLSIYLHVSWCVWVASHCLHFFSLSFHFFLYSLYLVFCFFFWFCAAVSALCSYFSLPIANFSKRWNINTMLCTVWWEIERIAKQLEINKRKERMWQKMIHYCVLYALPFGITKKN